jgi:hypothetical protein
MRSAFVFDLDGAPIDGVDEHVIAWNKALLSDRLSPPPSGIHRKIGMSSEFFAKQLLRDLGGAVGPKTHRATRTMRAEARKQRRDLCPIV